MSVLSISYVSIVCLDSHILQIETCFLQCSSMAATSQSLLLYLLFSDCNKQEVIPQFPFEYTFDTGHPLDLPGTLASHGTLAKLLIRYHSGWAALINQISSLLQTRPAWYNVLSMATTSWSKMYCFLFAE